MPEGSGVTSRRTELDKRASSAANGSAGSKDTSSLRPPRTTSSAEAPCAS